MILNGKCLDERENMMCHRLVRTDRESPRARSSQSDNIGQTELARSRSVHLPFNYTWFPNQVTQDYTCPWDLSHDPRRQSL